MIFMQTYIREERFTILSIHKESPARFYHPYPPVFLLQFINQTWEESA